MPLARPLVVGPVSTLSRNVRVKGQLTGATITIVSRGASPRILAGGVADSPDTRFELNPGQALKPDDILYAVQKIGIDTSPNPNASDPLGVPVMKAPTAVGGLSAVTISSTVYTCGRAAWLRGGVPGALGHVRTGVSDLGNGTFEDGEGARFEIAPMFTGGAVQALQSIPGVGEGPTVSRTPLALPGPPRGPLAAPDIVPVPVACNTSVKVTGVFDGSEVTIRRDDGTQITELVYMFDAPSLRAPVGDPLAEGEMLTLSQAVHGECSRTPTERQVRVEAAPPVPKPFVQKPLCAGATLVVLMDLVPGATVQVFANGKTYLAQTPLDATSLFVIVDPLEAPPPGETRVVSARQEQCGVFGPNADDVTVDPLPGSVPPHRIAPPLLACSPIVRVEDAHPGAVLMAFSDVLGPISGYVTADFKGKATIPVAPQLIQGHTIDVLQWACGGSPTKARAPVEFTEHLPVPSVGDPFIGKRSIEIGDLVPGARVEVVVTDKNGTVREVAAFVAEDKVGTAQLQNGIVTGDKLKARQGLCAVLTGFSADRTAMVQPIQQDWWKWNGANPRNEVWNEDYTVSGAFTNKGGTPIQDFEVTIFEDAAIEGNASQPLVAPGQAVPGATGVLKKDWTWFIGGLWVVKGPTFKQFDYKASIAAKDVDGNPYAPVSSAILRIFVNVPKWKRTAGAMAMGAAASAAAMAASIVLIVAAGVAYAAAAAAGAIAMDPPIPDPRFRRRVPLPGRRSVPAGVAGRELMDVLTTMERVMAIQLAKSAMEGKRLGAVAAGDDTWAARHAQDQQAATLLQKQLASDALARAPQAEAAALAEIPPGTDLTAERAALKASGLTPALAQQGMIAPELLLGFDAVLRSDAASPDPDLATSLDETFAAFSEFVETLET